MSKDVWDKLESIHASKGPARKTTLLKRLMLHKIPEGGDIKDHFNDLLDAVDKLQAMNVEINDDMLAIIILYSLPNSYDTFRCAIKSRDDLPNADTLKIKIIEESEACKQKSTDNESGALSVKQNQQQHRASKNKLGNSNKDTSSSTHTRIKCNYCKKLGHKAANCYSKRANTNEKYSHAPKTTLLINDKISGKWCLDSGCTSHLCSDKDLFVDTKYISSGLNLANNVTTKIEAIGDVEMTASNGNETRKIRLKDTLYVPDLRTNLMSVTKIVDNQHEVLFKRNHAIIRDSQGNAIAIAKHIGDLFYLQEESSQQAQVACKDK